MSDCRVNGRSAELLDIVRFGYISDSEDPAQPENIVIDHGDWLLVDTLPSEKAYDFLRPYLTPGPDLLGGASKGIPDEVAQKGVDASLTVVEPDSLRFQSQNNPFRPGRQARAIFELESQWYDLGITDTIVAPKVKSADDGSYLPVELGFPDFPHAVITVSLAEPLRGTRWKLAAAVQFLPGSEEA